MQCSSQFGEPGSHLTSTSSPFGSVSTCKCMFPQFQTQKPAWWMPCPSLGQISCPMPSPYSHHKESSQKGTTRKGHLHSSGPSQASPGLVSRVSPSLPCSTHQASTGPLVSSPAQVRGSARKPREAAPSRLASMRSSLGSSSSVLCLMEHAQLPGTQGVYSAHWDRWVRWCADHSVPPHNPSCHLTNFLAFLSSDKGLSASSVRCTGLLSAPLSVRWVGPPFLVILSS